MNDNYSKFKIVVNNTAFIEAFSYTNLILYIVHVLIRSYTRFKVNQITYGYCKISHGVIEVISTLNATIAAIIFWTDKSIDSYKYKIDYQQTISLIQAMIVVRFLFLSSYLCGFIYLLYYGLCKRNRVILSWVEGFEIINEQEFTRRERLARRPRIKEKLQKESITYENYKAQMVKQNVEDIPEECIICFEEYK